MTDTHALRPFLGRGKLEAVEKEVQCLRAQCPLMLLYTSCLLNSVKRSRVADTV